MESLESREMLSVNPLGIDINYNYNSPDFVQTNAAQDFQTEEAGDISFSEITHTKLKVTLINDNKPTLVASTEYYLQYNKGGIDSWVNSEKTFTTTEAGALSLSFVANLEGLDPGATYSFRLNTAVNKDDATDESSSAIALNGTESTVAAPTVSSTSFDNTTHTLTINLSGLIDTKTYTLGAIINEGVKSVSTWGGDVNDTTLTADGETATITVATSAALEIGDKVAFTLTGETIKLIDETITATDVIPGEIAVTGGTTVTGLTSNAATITLPKVKNAKTYEVSINGEPLTPSTKNQITLTGLDADTKYEIKVVVKNTAGTVLNLDGSTGGTTIDLGSFSTWDAADAAAVKNPAINGGIAATYAASGKDYDGTAVTNAIKVTWKAPANYTGAYAVKIQQVDEKGEPVAGNNFTVIKKIPAGFKAEAFITSVTSGFTVARDAYYKVTVFAGIDDQANAVIAPEVVVATGSNKIENYNEAEAGTATPATVAATTGTASASAGFAIKATVTPHATPTNTVGYWVALYIDGSAPDTTFDASDTNIKELAYVANSGTVAFDVNFGGLITSATYKAMVWAVNADGKVEDGVEDNGLGDAPDVPTGIGTPTATYTDANNMAYAGTLKATPGTGTLATSTVVTWKNTQSEDDKEDTTIVGWQVSYSIDNGAHWILSQQVASTALTATVTGLDLANVKYQFKVQAIVKEVQDAPINDNFGLDKGATVIATKINVTLAKVSKVTPASAQGVDKIEVSWTAVTGASAYLVTVQDGKGVVYQGITAGISFDSSAVPASLTLVPGVKYDVSVSAIAYNGSDDVVKSAASKGSATTVKFSEPNLKIAQGKKAQLTSVELAIDEKVTTAPSGTTRAYVIEYTYVADAKNKPDWSTAKIETGLTLSNLKAGTQYYARVVAYDTETSTKDQTDSAKIIIGKELKFKTLAAPLATITKPAFALNSDGNLALKFTGKIPVDKANSPVLRDNTNFFYELIVSTDAVVDKATGKLANGQSFATGELTSTGSGKDKDVFDNAITQVLTGTSGVFKELKAYDLAPASFKALNFQLLVYYTTNDADSGVYATAYTKVAKLALPKWFV
jgi:hypothetical protein